MSDGKLNPLFIYYFLLHYDINLLNWYPLANLLSFKNIKFT